MPDELPLVWRYLEKQIMSGLSRGQGDECYPEKMYEGVLDGTSQMWAMHDETELDAVIILSVEDSATRKVWVDLLAGDNLTKWADELESTLIDFKKSVGARHFWRRQRQERFVIEGADTRVSATFS
jgi:hypothetical protein